MDLVLITLTILGLTFFEVITSIDNAIINAEVLSGMSKKAQGWFLLWGFFIAVILVRGLLPFLMIWATNPSLGITDVFFATISGKAEIHEAIERSAPVLLVGGAVFLIFLFFNWLFIEHKNYGLYGERFFHEKGEWFFTVISILLSVIVWFALKVNPVMAFSAVLGSTAFFIIHGFRQYAEEQEMKLLKGGMSDTAKIAYLEVLDASFSIDGVIGAFAFTLSVPLILLGNGLGAFILRRLTVSNIENIKKYKYLKNGAMYSILFLGTIMLLDAFGMNIPAWVSPIVTFGTVGYFFHKSRIDLKTIEVSLEPVQKKRV